MNQSADMDDARFFMQHPDRRAHMRTPHKVTEISDQRAAIVMDECEREFRTLGGHKRDRRRILLWRVPPDNPFYDPAKPSILKIPFLLYADETVEDRDDILLPIIHEIMKNAAKVSI